MRSFAFANKILARAQTMGFDPLLFQSSILCHFYAQNLMQLIHNV
jgi:hypothetical protein